MRMWQSPFASPGGWAKKSCWLNQVFGETSGIDQQNQEAGQCGELVQWFWAELVGVNSSQYWSGFSNTGWIFPAIYVGVFGSILGFFPLPAISSSFVILGPKSLQIRHVLNRVEGRAHLAKCGHLYPRYSVLTHVIQPLLWLTIPGIWFLSAQYAKADESWPGSCFPLTLGGISLDVKVCTINVLSVYLNELLRFLGSSVTLERAMALCTAGGFVLVCEHSLLAAIVAMSLAT